MKTSEQIGKLAEALAKAQHSFRPVVKDKVAHVKSDKGSYSFAYADLASVLDAVRDALAANMIAVVQATGTGPEGITVETRLVHASGEWMESAITMKVEGNRPQNIGSAITYARRYGLSAMVGISSEEDDDANAAQGHQREIRERKSNGAAEAVRAAAAKPPTGSAKRIPQTPEERKEDLKARMKALGVPGAQMAEQLGEWIGRAVDKDTVFGADDWTRADTAIEQSKNGGDALARARSSIQQAEQILS
jgi:hypothetical protein